MAEAGVMKRCSQNSIYPRMLGYAVTLMTHTWNAFHLLTVYQGDILEDPDIAFYFKYVYRMLTVWLCGVQLVYSALGLSCDIMSLTSEQKDQALLKTLKSIRNPTFSLFVFPYAMIVSSAFWTAFSIEPTLLLSLPLLKTFPSISNHIMHTFIAPAAIWEVIFRPRKTPDSHLLNMVVVFLGSCLYIVMLYKTYYESNRFQYPMLTLTYGTPYFYVIIGSTVMGLLVSYRLQWHLTELVWGRTTEMAKKIK